MFLLFFCVQINQLDTRDQNYIQNFIYLAMKGLKVEPLERLELADRRLKLIVAIVNCHPMHRPSNVGMYSNLMQTRHLNSKVNLNRRSMKDQIIPEGLQVMVKANVVLIPNFVAFGDLPCLALCGPEILWNKIEMQRERKKKKWVKPTLMIEKFY